jgi:hypothetical protein
VPKLNALWEEKHKWVEFIWGQGRAGEDWGHIEGMGVGRGWGEGEKAMLAQATVAEEQSWVKL